MVLSKPTSKRGTPPRKTARALFRNRPLAMELLNSGRIEKRATVAETKNKGRCLFTNEAQGFGRAEFLARRILEWLAGRAGLAKAWVWLLLALVLQMSRGIIKASRQSKLWFLVDFCWKAMHSVLFDGS